MGEVSSKSQMGKIRNFEKGFVATHLINIGAKLGIFEALNAEKEGMTVAVLASKLGVHEPYLEIWLKTAYHFEILDYDNLGRFKLQPFLDEILGEKSSVRNYLNNIALTVDHFGKFFEDYPECFRTGKTIEDMYTLELSNAAYETTKNIHLVFFFMIFPKNDHLKQMLNRGIRFLDIGCGRGDLVINLAQAFGNSVFVGADPNIYGIEAAKKVISQLGLEKRVSVENIRGEELPYHEEFDIVSMILTLHEIPLDIRHKVLEEGYTALKADGYLLILDFPYPTKLEDFRNPMYDYGILDQFYEVCVGVSHLDVRERDELLKEVGFRNFKKMTIGEGMVELLMATK